VSEKAHMRELGRKGGLATKARSTKDPAFFARIGRLGGSNGAGKPKPRRPREAVPERPVLASIDALIAELNA